MRTGMRITSSGVVGYRICISANIFSRRTGRRCGDRRGPGRRKTPRGGAYRGKRPGNGAGADKVPEGYPWDAQAQSASRERRGGYAQCGTGAGFQCRPAAADAILNLRWRGGRAVECGGLLIRCTGIMPVPRVRIPPSPPKLEIGIGSRNGVAPQARHKGIPAKNSRIQKVFPRSAWLSRLPIQYE